MRVTSDHRNDSQSSSPTQLCRTLRVRGCELGKTDTLGALVGVDDGTGVGGALGIEVGPGMGTVVGGGDGAGDGRCESVGFAVAVGPGDGAGDGREVGA